MSRRLHTCAACGFRSRFLHLVLNVLPTTGASHVHGRKKWRADYGSIARIDWVR